MPDIFHHFPINGSAQQVFEAISTPKGLNAWWTEDCRAEPAPDAEYQLDFGAGYRWKAIASLWEPHSRFELKLTEADKDWLGTLVGFELTPQENATVVKFHHLGWPEQNEHYEISCFCWAMYLRLLKRYVEFGEIVPYPERLNV